MASMNISLPEQMKSWVETRLTTSRFSNTSDYVRHLIRCGQEREQAIDLLQKAIDEVLTSGPPEPFAFVAFKLRMRERHVPK